MKPTLGLKGLIEDEAILVMPGLYDGVSAVLAQKAGFRAVCIGGYPATASLLGRPDLSILTLREMADHIRNLAGALDIPLLADGDTGYGGIHNVRRAVREFEAAGAGGIILEDQLFPKRCGHMEGKGVIPADEMAAKLKCALDARTDPEFVVVARTDACAVEGLESAVERAALYGEIGADLLFVEALTSVEDMVKTVSALSFPCLANMVEGGKTPLLPAAQLEQIGYSVVVYPVAALYTAAKAVGDLFKRLYDTGTTQPLEKMMTFGDFNALMDLEAHHIIEANYRRGRQKENGGP